MLAQQDIHKELHDEKLTDIATIYWNEMKGKIKGLISLCVSDDVINHILNLTTLKDVWDKLENQYMFKTLMSKMFMKQCLQSFQQHLI